MQITSKSLAGKGEPKGGLAARGKQKFSFKDGRAYPLCIQVLLEMIEQRGKMNGHLELMATYLKRDSEPCPDSEGLVWFR